MGTMEKEHPGQSQKPGQGGQQQQPGQGHERPDQGQQHPGSHPDKDRQPGGGRSEPHR